MRILFVTAYPLEYNSSANVRNLGLIEGMLSCGHIVSTLSPYPSDLHLFNGRLLDLPFEERFWIGEQAIPKERSTVMNRAKIIDSVRSSLYKLYNYFCLYDRRKLLVSHISNISYKQPFDVVISSSDPKSAHLLAERILQINTNLSKKWIQYWGDPFSDDVSSRRIFGKRRVLKEERRLLSLCDKAVYTSPFTAEVIAEKHEIYSGKVQFLPIPYRLSNIEEESTNALFTLIGYLGDYNSRNRNIRPLYNVLKNNNIPSYIVGNSDLALESTKDVRVKGRLGADELRTITEKISVYICLCNIYGSQIPGKVYHYVNTKKPIIVIVDGDYGDKIKTYLASFKRFLICDNNENSILECIKTAINSDPVMRTPDALNPITISQNFLKI